MFFGLEVGNVVYYQKNMVVDLNGQVSISYLDQEGWVIVIFFVGEVLQNVQFLEFLQIFLLDMNVDLLVRDVNGVFMVNQVDYLVYSIEFL